MILNFLVASSLLFSQCGAGVHPDTLNAIIKVESNYNPLAIFDNTTDISYKPKSKEQAIYWTNLLLSAGHSIDVGLMQINSRHFSKTDMDYTRLFDPCYNVSTGTYILAGFYRTHAMSNPQDKPDVILLKALSSYNTGSPYRGKNYVRKILKAARKSIWNPINEEYANEHTKPDNIHNKRSIAFFKKEEAEKETKGTELSDERGKAR